MKKIMVVSAVFLQFVAEATDPASAAAGSPSARPRAFSVAPREFVGARKKVKDYLDQKKRLESDDRLQNLQNIVRYVSGNEEAWNDLRKKATEVAEKAVRSPTKENFKELVGLYDKFHETVLKDIHNTSIDLVNLEFKRGRSDHDDSLIVFLRGEGSANLKEFMKKNFGVLCYLYRTIAVFANELKLDPEDFIHMVLIGEDPTSIRDGVIWNVDELNQRKGAIDRANDADFENYWNCLKLCHTKNLRTDPILSGLQEPCPIIIDLNQSVPRGYTIDDGFRTGEFSLNDGVLFRKVGEVNTPLLFPIREDMFGEIGYEVATKCNIGRTPCPTPVFVTLNYCDESFPETSEGGGWKLHVSATPSSAAKVANVVVPYLLTNKIDFKIVPTTGALRSLNLDSKFGVSGGHYSQYGKFITIYPLDGEGGAKIARDLDDMLCQHVFTRKDFVTCAGEFSIGKSGALSTRYTDSYSRDGGSSDVRRAPLIRKSSLEVAAASIPMYPLFYCGVKMSGVLDANLSSEKAKRCRQALFIENIERLGLTTDDVADPDLMRTVVRS
ncbi:MAG: hypothetical protein LBB21_01070 [Holosporaceae bacterium]|jgi:hypothetical protein|nr:hypothetical protein [Holosporaceae bacterium]